MLATDVANYMIYLLNDSCDDLTNMKLNKLLYYAQGYSLKQRGCPLFDDTIEAWQHGPVVPSVYHHYKNNHDDPIHQWDEKRLDAIDEESKELIFNVAKKYSEYTAIALRNMTHSPKGPWSQCYKDDEKYVIIPTGLIKDYFDHYEQEIAPFEIQFDESDFIGHRDSSGYLVLPEDWND